jgi:ferrous iron transport protein B
MMKNLTIAVAGNPNCGKTTLFNELTGARQMVGNWPGVTVDRVTGLCPHAEHVFNLVDIPGIYALTAQSTDEKVARDYLLSGDADLVVCIVDAGNIERNLYLTTQLLELDIPLIVVLNKMDVARARQIEIDIERLATRLGIPVVPVVASKRKGLEALKQTILEQATQQLNCSARIIYPEAIQSSVSRLSTSLNEVSAEWGIPASWLALKLLEEDDHLSDPLSSEIREQVEHEQKNVQAELSEDADILIADARFAFINQLLSGVVQQKTKISRNLTEKIDRILLNRILGLPVFLLCMYLTFMFTINVGGAFIDFFDIAAGAIFVAGMGDLLAAVQAPAWVIGILATGVGGGMQTVATFIPPIAFMFLALAFLEGSGYMARAAFVMDRFMRTLGLPGKAFVPMLVGFGCNVPAIMATRTLENQRDRTLTIMMNPFMSCGARLPVYALFAAAFFPVGGQNVVFLLYLAGIGFAVLTGLILKQTLLKGAVTPFVMELPAYHLPTFKSVLLRTWDRLRAFMGKAARILIPMVAVLALLNTMSTDGTIGHEDSRDSLLSSVSRTVTPIFAPMGIRQDNWPATVGIFTGLFAKEAVVGTLDAVYLQNEFKEEGNQGSQEGARGELLETLHEALLTIPANLSSLTENLSDPLGLSVGDTSSMASAAEQQEVSAGTFGVMGQLFDGRIGAVAYMLFILMYFPCVAAMTAIYRETNIRWTAFAASWNTGLAYLAATCFYQLATFARHPAFSSAWLVGSVLFFCGTLAVLRRIGIRSRETIWPGYAGRPQSPAEQ